MVIIDESGLSERRSRVRSGVPRGQTPAIRLHFNGQPLPMIAKAGLTNVCFRLHEGSLRSGPIRRLARGLVNKSVARYSSSGMA
jgi:hypothetical protein